MDTITAPGIMDRLREETKTAHQQLEKQTLPFIRNAVDNASYSRLLSLFYGFFAPTEQLINQYITTDLIPDNDSRRKSESLLEDYKSAGGNEAALNQSAILPQINSIPAALGAMYVLEGSTLGGQHISKMLMKQLGKSDMSGITFFNGYGEATHQRWAAFTATLNDYAAKHPEAQDEMVAAADATFTAFMQWAQQGK